MRRSLGKKINTYNFKVLHLNCENPVKCSDYMRKLWWRCTLFPGEAHPFLEFVLNSGFDC